MKIPYASDTILGTGVKKWKQSRQYTHPHLKHILIGREQTINKYASSVVSGSDKLLGFQRKQRQIGK